MIERQAGAGSGKALYVLPKGLAFPLAGPCKVFSRRASSEVPKAALRTRSWRRNAPLTASAKKALLVNHFCT